MPQNSYEGKIIAERYKLAKALGKAFRWCCEIDNKILTMQVMVHLAKCSSRIELTQARKWR